MGDAYDGALYCTNRVANDVLPSYDTRREIIECSIRNILYAIGEDPDREGLRDTPNRVARMYLNELTVGLGVDLETLLTATFKEPHDQMVIVKDISFHSLCEHHMVPYSGKAHVGYVPDGQVVGLSKLARVVEMASKKLSIQERLTNEIAEAVMSALLPKGVIVVLDAVIAWGFAIHAAEDACFVQPDGLDLIQVRDVVERRVHHGPVVLAGGDQDRRLTSPEQVVRVVGMEGDWR